MNKFKNGKTKSALHNLILFVRKNPHLLLLPIISTVILYIHYIHFSSFSFTDAYNSYARAYFMDKGRQLYSEIFSHHHMLMVYFSFVIQKLTNPQNLYQLILYHRLAIGLFSVIMSVLIIFRFKWIGVGFIVTYELSKYYLFGNLFLAEAIVAYLLVYVFGLAWLKLLKQELSRFDVLFSVFFTWIIFFLREPFIPVAGLLLTYIIYDKRYIKTKAVSIGAAVLMSIAILLTVQFDDYFFNMITLNFGGYIQDEMGKNGISGIGLLKIFLYPIYIFVSGQNTDFRMILLLLSSVFLITAVSLLIKRKYYLVGAVILLLGLANIRFRDPGNVFYAGFHMLPWYSLFVFVLFLMSQQVAKVKEFYYHKFFVAGLVSISILIAVLPPYSVIYRGVDLREEFNTNYGRFYVYGEVIKVLSDSDDHLFVDNWDTLVYWQSGLDSNYTYAMYFPVMSTVERFSKERENMFQNDPPEFYYTDCEESNSESLIPHYRVNDYTPLFYNELQSCLYIHNDKIRQISLDQWERALAYGFNMLKK